MAKYQYELRYPQLSKSENEFVDLKKQKATLQEIYFAPPSAPKTGPASAPGPKSKSDPNREEILTGILLEEKTKKGNWKVRVGDLSGTLVAPSLPGNLKPGDSVKVRIQSAHPTDKNAYVFEFLK